MLMPFIEQSHSFITLDASEVHDHCKISCCLTAQTREALPTAGPAWPQDDRPPQRRKDEKCASQPAQMTFLTQCLRTVALRQVQQSPTHTNYLSTGRSLTIGSRSTRLLQQKSIPSRLRDSRPSERTMSRLINNERPKTDVRRRRICRPYPVMKG